MTRKMRMKPNGMLGMMAAVNELPGGQILLHDVGDHPHGQRDGHRPAQ